MSNTAAVICAWMICGLLTYWVKYDKFKDAWKEDGNQVFFVAVLIGCLVFGAVGLLVTLFHGKGKGF